MPIIDTLSIASAARDSAREVNAACKGSPPIQSVDALLALDEDLSSAADRLIGEGWSRTAIRCAIEDGITLATVHAP